MSSSDKLLVCFTIKTILELRKFCIIPIYKCSLWQDVYDLNFLTSGFLIYKMEARSFLSVIVMMKCQHLTKPPSLAHGESPRAWVNMVVIFIIAPALGPAQRWCSM